MSFNKYKNHILIDIIVTIQIFGEKLSDYYTAAVVEYSPIFIKDDIKLTYEKNTDEYINYIERASKQVSSINLSYNFYDININNISNLNPFLKVYFKNN